MVPIIGILEQWKRKSQVNKRLLNKRLLNKRLINKRLINKHLLNKQDGDLLQGQY